MEALYILMTRELIWKLVPRGQKNNQKKLLTMCDGVSNLRISQWNNMPNQPAPDKDVLSVRIPRTLKRRLEKQAERKEMTLSQFVEWLLNEAVKNTELTPDDYNQIAEETARAIKRASAKGVEKKALDARYGSKKES